MRNKAISFEIVFIDGLVIEGEVVTQVEVEPHGPQRLQQVRPKRLKICAT